MIMHTFFCPLIIQITDRKLGSIRYPLNLDPDIQKDYGYFKKNNKGLQEQGQRLSYFAFTSKSQKADYKYPKV